MPQFKKNHKYVYYKNGKPTSHVIIACETWNVPDDVYKHWIDTAYGDDAESKSKK